MSIITAISLHFNDSFLSPFQIQLLTHTLVQIYTRGEWYDAICKCDKFVSRVGFVDCLILMHWQRRRFSIPLAIELKSYVIAFTSADMLTKVLPRHAMQCFF